MVTLSYRLPAGVNTISLVIVYSPSGRPLVSSVWIVKVCVYVKLSRSILNSASRAANFWTISSIGIVGGPSGRILRSRSWPLELVDTCCRAASGRNAQATIKHVNKIIAARRR